MKKFLFAVLLLSTLIFVVSCVSKEENVISIAEQKAIETYGKETVENEKPLKAELKNGIWVVEGTFRCFDANEKEINVSSCKGGVTEVKISDDTLEVLDITHGQ